MATHDDNDLEHVWPPYGAAPAKAVTPETLRRFDLSTSPERYYTWCTALERRIEHLEQCIHRLLNPGEVEP